LQDELRRIVDSLPGLVWTSLPDGYVDFLNQRWCDYTGLSLEKACGWGWNAAICPEDLPALLDCWRSILASGEPGEIEARMRRFDGKHRWFLFEANPSRDASGKIVRWYGTYTDIEDRKVVEEALREGELRYRLILDNIPGLVSTRAATGAPEFVNRKMLEFFGQSLEQLPDWSSLIHPDDRERVVSLWRRSLETGQPYDVEHRARRADGVYRWIHARGEPLRDPEGRVVRWCNMLGMPAIMASPRPLDIRQTDRMMAIAAEVNAATRYIYLNRAAHIGKVFARFGLDARAASSAADRAKRLRAALEELGPTFAKLGQILSTRPDLVPPDVVDELAKLQDDVAPLTEAEIVHVMEQELQVPWEDVFESIDPEPLAAGTIGQVHRATLETGEHVVVKVQRPNAQEEITRDLGLLQLFGEKALHRDTLRGTVDIPALVSHLSESLRRELDFIISKVNEVLTTLIIQRVH